jgi:hypothetical protein
MYVVDNLDILWHPEITPVNGFPDISPDSIGTRYINGASCDRVIAARFAQSEMDEGERAIEWLMQRPRGQKGTGRVVFAWVPMSEVQNIGAG